MSNRIALRSFNPSTRLAGHGLWSEGWPVEAAPGHGEGWRPGLHRAAAGRALCECGEMSPVLDSVNKRKRWHKEHKEQVRNELAEVAGGEPAKAADPLTVQCPHCFAGPGRACQDFGGGPALMIHATRIKRAAQEAAT